MSSYLQHVPFSGTQPVQPQLSINFPSAIPIKKRRIPIIQPPSPPPSPESKIPCSEDPESKTKQEPRIPIEKCPSAVEAKNPSSDLTVDEEATQSNIEQVQANVDILPSKPREAEPTVGLKTVPGWGNEMNVESKEKSPGPKVPEICSGSQTANVKQEVCGIELSMSLGPKEPLIPVPDLEHQKSGSYVSDLDPSLFNLAPSEKSVCTTVGDVNRSNWDLNTTMDVWGEGSTNSFADIGGFVKTINFRDEKSSLTTAKNVGVSLNKGKSILDAYRPDLSNTTVQPDLQCKIDDSLGLKLAMPLNLVSTRASSNTCFEEQVHLSPMNVSRPVKSEPVDENCKHDYSVGSSSSSNAGSLKLNTVKTELIHNRGLEIVLNSSVIPDKSVNCKPEDASSSSSSCLPLPLRLPSCSELMTSGDLSSLLELSLRNKEKHENQLRPGDTGNSSIVHTENHKLARVDEHTIEAPDDDEKMNILAEMNVKESTESHCGSRGKGVGENVRGKEDEELEEGEVRETLQPSAIKENPIDNLKSTDSLEFAGIDTQNLQHCDLSGDQDLIASDFDEKDSSLKENTEKNDSNKDISSIICEPQDKDNALPKVSETVLEVGLDEKRFVTVTPDSKDIEEASGKEISSDIPTNARGGMLGIDLEDAVTTDNKVVNEICSGEDNVEAYLDGLDDAAKDASNKSRIIYLARASVEKSPCKTRSIPNRLLTPRSGKERYSDYDREIQQRRNRDENYVGGSNKSVKDRVHNQRNSRPNFMHGRGRMSGRFGSLRGEWGSDYDFASGNSYGPSDYRSIKRKHTSSISDVEVDCNEYDIQQAGNNRRKSTNGDFSPSLRRTNLRGLSPGENRDGPANRGNQTFRRFPRNNNNNMSSNRWKSESGSDMMGFQRGDRFMRHLSDDMINPGYNHPQVMYDELDGPIERGNRNFSNMQRKVYPQINSKSPGRSRTRSPGPWSSPRRRSPNGLQDLSQHRSPGFYRTGRMRSPDRSCFHDEMVPRRRGGSPSYVTRNSNNDLRDVDPGREHVHPRSSGNSNRRTSPAQVILRSGRRTDALDSREMGDGGDEYMNNGPMQSNKFHELRGDRGMDERRKLVDRHGPGRSFRPNDNGDGENFRFHMNNGPRPYRFCPDGDTEFVERGNMREREFDGRIKHQNMVQNRRNRNVEEQQQDGNGNYMPVERVWHDDGFGDGRVKRRF